MNKFFELLTAVSDFFGGAEEPMIRGLVIMASIVIVLAIALMAWHFTPRRERRQVINHLAEAIGLGQVGERLGNEEELEDVRENPAPADSMPEIPRMEPTIRRRKPSPAPLPQNPRLHLVATIAEKDGHLAHFTTKRRNPRTGQVERYRSQDCAVMVNDSGNRHWVRP